MCPVGLAERSQFSAAIGIISRGTMLRRSSTFTDRATITLKMSVARISSETCRFPPEAEPQTQDSMEAHMACRFLGEQVAVRLLATQVLSLRTPLSRIWFRRPTSLRSLEEEA